jgi:uncharacterized membrane protein YkoI
MRARLVRVSMAFLFLSVAIWAFAQEVRIERSQMPDADQKTADEQSKGATVHGYFMEITGGQILYKVELTVNGHSKDVIIDSKGNVLKIEDEIAFDKLPTAVRKALQKKTGSGTITRTESITKLGSIVAYEAKVITNGKKSEVQVSPDGKPLDHEE